MRLWEWRFWRSIASLMVVVHAAMGPGCASPGEGVAGGGGLNGGGPDGSSSEVNGGGLPTDYVTFVSASSGTSVAGVIEVALAPVGVAELKLEALEVWADGTLLFQDTKLPTRFSLDTRQFENLEHVTLEATARRPEGQASASLTFIPDNPTLELAWVTPDQRELRSGQEVTIAIESTGRATGCSADFSAIDSTYVAGAEDVVVTGDDRYEIRYTLGAQNSRPSGMYDVPVSLVGEDGEVVVDAHLQLRLQALPRTPIRLDGALYIPDSLPDPTSSIGAPGVSVSNLTVVTGGSTTVRLDVSSFGSTSRVVGVLVGSPEYAGYFQIPVAPGAGTWVDAIVKLRPFGATEQAPEGLPLAVAVRDERGRISQYREVDLSVLKVGSGDVQVNVSWDNATDVDLHVEEPTGCELYWGNKSCGSGAFLDLDSNVSCDIDGINNENAYWPKGAAPAGLYTVRVDFYEDCCSCGANYAVTINTCGKTRVITGEFAPNTGDEGGIGAGTVVATFSPDDCQKRVQGRIRYEDRPVDRNGFGPRTWRPVRFAAVELHRMSDGVVLAEGVTDIDGFYELPFQGDHGSVVVVLKAQTAPSDAVREVVVMNHPKSRILYRFEGASFVDDEPGGAVYTVDLSIAEEDGAGVLNVFDVLVSGYDALRTMTGAVLGRLDGYWVTGADTTDTLYCSQFLYDTGVCTEVGSLSIQGKSSDRDEYDDMVILRQLFKFALDRLSRDDNPGGQHDGTRDDPRRAWVEGVSTFFACDVLGTPWFVNAQPSGVFLVEDLEYQDAPFAFGTSTGLMGGHVSPKLVAAVAWDLADTGGDGDPVEGSRFGIYDSAFHYLPRESFTDRGASGVDLVDLLDGWLCRGWGQREGLANVVVTQRQLPYDFGGPTDCGL